MMDRDREQELVNALLRAYEEGSEVMREAGYAAQASADFARVETREANANFVLACTTFRISVTLAALALREFWDTHEPAPDVIHHLPAATSLITTTTSVDPDTLRSRLTELGAQVEGTSERLRAVADNDEANTVAVALDADLAELEATCGTIVQAVVGFWTYLQGREVQAQLDGFSTAT